MSSHSHQHCTRKGSSVPTSSATPVIFCFFDSSHPDGCEVVSHCASVFIFKYEFNSELSTERYAVRQNAELIGFSEDASQKNISPFVHFLFCDRCPHLFMKHKDIYLCVFFFYCMLDVFRDNSKGKHWIGKLSGS